MMKSRFNLKIDDKTYAKLKSLAYQLDVKIAQIVRYAVEKLIEEHEKDIGKEVEYDVDEIAVSAQGRSS